MQNFLAQTSNLIAWNAENRLSTVTKNNVTESYAYDADGNRIKTTSSGVTTHTFFPFYEEENGVAVKYYTFNGQRIAVRRGGVLSYLHSDHLGSSSKTTNASGTEIASRTYYAYGSTRSSSGNLQTDRTYTGQKADETGLMFFEARYYDSALGTFLSPDTMVPSVSNAKSYNRYMYVLGNPLKFTDPTGHMEAECLNGESCTRYQTLRPNRNTPPPTNSGPSGACDSIICLPTPTPTPSVDLLPSWGPTPTPRAQIGPQQYFVAPYVTGDIDQGVGDVLVHKEIRSDEFRGSAFGIRLAGTYPAVAPDIAGGGYGHTTITKTWEYANGTYVLISDEVDLAAFTAPMNRTVAVTTDTGYSSFPRQLGTAQAYSQGGSNRPVGFWIPSELGNPAQVSVSLMPVMQPKYLMMPPYPDIYSVSLR